MNRNFIFSIEEFYHIYNRGTEKRFIFLDESDYQRFKKLLYLCNSKKNIVFRDVPKEEIYGYDRGETIVDIGAYCLMQNHFHLLLREKTEGGISAFMQKLLTAYSSYFNKKYGRTGGLFEGVFKATHADFDEYLKYLFSYIHLNPVKIIDPGWKVSGITNKKITKKYLAGYSQSSYLDYLGTKRKEGVILNRTAFPGYFMDKQDFEGHVDGWLAFKDIM